jgi:hypothetical protein
MVAFRPGLRLALATASAVNFPFTISDPSFETYREAYRLQRRFRRYIGGRRANVKREIYLLTQLDIYMAAYGGGRPPNPGADFA